MSKVKLIMISSLLIGLVAALTLFGACNSPTTTGPTTSTEPATSKVVKIGAPGPLSGMAAAWGLPEDRGLRMLVDKVNSEGGLTLGSDTYTFVVISADTGFTVEGATAAAHKLLDMDKIKYAIGGIDKHETLSLQAVFEPAGVIHFHDAWGYDIVTTSAPHSFRIPPSPQDFTPAIFDWFKTNRPDVKKIYLSGYDTPGIRDTNEIAKSYLSKMGFEIVGEDYFAFEATEYYPLITRFIDKGAQLVWMGGSTVPQDALMTKQAKEKGFNGFILHPAPVSGDDIVALSGESAEGFMSLNTINSGELATPEAKEYYNAYIQSFGKWESNVFDISVSFQILTEAMKKANSVNVDDVLTVLHGGGPFNTMFGEAIISGESLYGINCQVYQPMGLCQIMDGKQIPLAVLTAERQVELVKELTSK